MERVGVAAWLSGGGEAEAAAKQAFWEQERKKNRDDMEAFRKLQELSNRKLQKQLAKKKREEQDAAELERSGGVLDGAALSGGGSGDEASAEPSAAVGEDGNCPDGDILSEGAPARHDSSGSNQSGSNQWVLVDLPRRSGETDVAPMIAGPLALATPSPNVQHLLDAALPSGRGYAVTK